jgi:two-component system response regulator NreC
MPRSRLLLADEHALLRAGLRLLLDAQWDMKVVGEAGTDSDALRRLRGARVDILITGLDFPGNAGETLIERVRRRHPDVKVVVLSAHDEVARVRAALVAGAAGYVLKQSSARQLLSAIRAVRRGDSVVSPPRVAALLRSRGPARPGAASRPVGGLSEREQEVLRLLARGHTNQAIADRLGVSVKSVETYRSRLGLKLGLLTRSALVRYALETGLLSADD